MHLDTNTQHRHWTNFLFTPQKIKKVPRLRELVPTTLRLLPQLRQSSRKFVSTCGAGYDPSLHLAPSAPAAPLPIVTRDNGDASRVALCTTDSADSIARWSQLCSTIL